MTRLALLIARHSYLGHGLDIVDDSIFACRLSDFVCYLAACLCVLYVAPMRNVV